MTNNGHEKLVGRGARDGAQLFREWFQRLSDTAESGGHSAYVFVMGDRKSVV